MIGFGELRKCSLEWRMDLALVERAYATDWMLKGIFGHSSLDSMLILRGGSALRYAYSASYPLAEMPEFLITERLDEPRVRQALEQAVHAAAETSSLGFALDSFARGSAKIEFAGPLGRRSAAQPHIVLSFIPGRPRLANARLPLIHPFSDDCAVTVSTIAVEELIGERMALLAGQPRARDVFDLWFAATRLEHPIDWERARALASELTQQTADRGPTIALQGQRSLFDPAHRARLESTWDTALRNVPGHSAFADVERDLERVL